MKSFVCITGGIACGKSTVLKYLESLNYNTIIADDIVHQLFKQDEIKDIVERIIGDVIINNEIDKKKLRDIVFSDLEKKLLLESILHPRVNKIVKDEIKKHKSNVYECPLLFEKGLNWNPVILVTCNKETQINRLMNRNGLSREESIFRINQLIPDEYKKDKVELVLDTSNELNKELLKDYCEST